MGAALLALVIVGACILLFRWPFSASDLERVPDSVEYVAGALDLVHHGTYRLTLNGDSYPPRYPPGFSMLILAPAYKFLGDEPGNGIIPVFLFGLGGVVAAFFLGKRFTGYAGGWLAALFLLALPLFQTYGRSIMTDVPATTLLLVLCLMFVRLRGAGSAPSVPAFLPPALLIALSAALRPATAAVVLPFLWLAKSVSGPRRCLAAVVVLLVPLIVLAAGQGLYNLRAFGSPLRNGYHFWCPVPYDYPSLTFSLSYVKSNLMQLVDSKAVYVVGVIFLVQLLIRLRPRGADAEAPSLPAAGRSTGLFMVLGLTPLLVLHLLYFFPDPRLFLPVAALLAVLAGGMAGALLRGLPLKALLLIQACLILLAVVWHYRHPAPLPERRIAAETIRRYTPADSVIVGVLDPVFLGTVLGDASKRFVVPLSRSVEYASKLVCWKPVRHPNPYPAGPADHRCAGLKKGGALEVVPMTADENMGWLTEAVAQGRPVFLDTVGTTPMDLPMLEEFRRRFVLIPAAWSLFRLTLPGGTR